MTRPSARRRGVLPPPPRRDDPERLDQPGHDSALLAASLAHVGAVDRWLGGERAMRRCLGALVPSVPARLTLLDVGTGDGHVASRQAAWLERRGHSVRVIGVDLHAEVVARARARLQHLQRPGRPGPWLVRADGLRLPLRDASVDVAVATLTLHHFRAPEAVARVAEMRRVARVGVLVSDLERSRLHYLGARLLAATVWRQNPITSHDGPLSVLRSFTPDELETIGYGAGLRHVRVTRHPVYRLVLEGRP